MQSTLADLAGRRPNAIEPCSWAWLECGAVERPLELQIDRVRGFNCPRRRHAFPLPGLSKTTQAKRPSTMSTGLRFNLDIHRRRCSNGAQPREARSKKLTDVVSRYFRLSSS